MRHPNDGGPAYPVNDAKELDDVAVNVHPGMSLRDWFAGQALMAYVSGNIASTSHKIDEHKAATRCYQFADAMLAAREMRLVEPAEEGGAE